MTETATTPSGVSFVRTPDDRFTGLEDFPHEPRYDRGEDVAAALIAWLT